MRPQLDHLDTSPVPLVVFWCALLAIAPVAPPPLDYRAHAPGVATSEPRGSLAHLRVSNQASHTICKAFITPVGQYGDYIDRLRGSSIPSGATWVVLLEAASYNMVFQDCQSRWLAYRSDFEIASDSEIVIHDSDVDLARCFMILRQADEQVYKSYYDEALQTTEHAIDCFVGLSFRMGEADAWNSAGAVYVYQARYAEAIDAYLRALGIAREVGSREIEGSVLNNLGNAYHNQGQYRLALHYYKQALPVRERIGDRAGEAKVHNNIGVVYSEQNSIADALASLSRALSISRELNDQGIEATALLNIGQAYIRQHRNDEAVQVLEEALTIAHKLHFHETEGKVLNAIGLANAKSGRFGEATRVWDMALGVFRSVGARAMEGRTLVNIAGIYRDEGLHEKALDTYLSALEVLESVRAVAGSEEARAAFAGQFAAAYNDAASEAHKLGRDREAFSISERGRARAFLDTLATGRVQLDDEEAEQLLKRERALYSVRAAASKELLRLRSAQPRDDDKIASGQAALDELDRQYALVLSQIESRGTELASLVPGRDKTIESSSVQDLLDPDTALVSYMVQPSQTLAFVLTRDQFHAVALPVTREDLALKVEGLRDFADIDSALAPADARWLYAALIQPLRGFLDTKHLALVPSGPLHYLPFAALTGDGGAHYLVDEYVLSVLPSASVLPYIQKNAKKSTATVPMLVVGNPMVQGRKVLAYAEAEARLIAALYGVKALTGRDATLAAVARAVEHAGIVHLAAHGTYSKNDALASTVFLAPDGTDDGRLTVARVYGLKLKSAKLVVLSACQTQLGTQSAGDELVGLTRAFLYAGTPSTLTTLWSVDDETTGWLMRRFYEHLRAGLGKAEALQRAQQQLRQEQPEFANPYHWAAFVLSGEAY